MITESEKLDLNIRLIICSKLGEIIQVNKRELEYLKNILTDEEFKEFKRHSKGSDSPMKSSAVSDETTGDDEI